MSLTPAVRLQLLLLALLLVAPGLRAEEAVESESSDSGEAAPTEAPAPEPDASEGLLENDEPRLDREAWEWMEEAWAR